MKTKFKKIFISMFLVICFAIPTIFLSTGNYVLSRPGAIPTMGVIVGPIVIPDLDDGSGYNYTPDYSSSNLTRATPYSNGALRAYTSLGVYNNLRDNSYGSNNFHYLSFARYFKICRNDGRYIYDDDGILDVCDRNGTTDEIVNYPCYSYALTTDLPSDNGGFFWTTRQGRFSNAKLSNVYYNGTTYVTKDEKGVGTNPSDTTITIATIIDKNGNLAHSGNYVGINFNGKGYWENTFWGGTGGDYTFDVNLTSYFQVANRDWNNSLTANNVGTGTYLGKTAYYSPKEFTVIATNLNNYVKIDDVKATPKYGTSVVPFKDGHHITISNNGKTKVDIENGAEETYTTYYCFIDSTLPDLTFTYHNANAQNKRVVGNIVTNANGSKSQTINEGTFKDQVKIEFGYNPDTEAPESATYTFNGKTYPLTSGTWLSQEGSYTVTLTDLAGNTTISRFVIDTTNPNYNLGKLNTDKTYKISRWYVVDIPYGYSGYGSYSFANYDDCLSFATTLEEQNKVQKYTLNNISDFTQTNMIANGNSVKLGDYWYYKSKDNENLFVYYFDKNSLNEAINYYSSKYISEPQTYKINSTLSPNNYGNTIDESVIDNIIEVYGIKAYLINDFTFKYLDDNDTYKIYYDYQEDSVEDWREFSYKYQFSNQVTSNGLYKIKEIDYVGHETTYYVYLDKQGPMLDIKAKLYGKDKYITQTISSADIPTNSELIYYYEDFKILDVVEKDKWWVMEIKCPDSSIKRYTYLDELPNFSDLGSGEFTITVADRVNNIFKFKVVLLGKAPEAQFQTINANTQLQIKIVLGESYNTIKDLKIYRNGICLNSEIGYDEFPNDNTNELIYINTSTMKYVFNKGGIYTVDITDNFGRILSHEFKFEKELPTGVLVGVEYNGKTNNVVSFIYNSNKYFTVVTKNGEIYTSESEVLNNLTTLIISPETESEDNYSIQLFDKSDTENYNIYSFVIKTIKPKINLYGVEPNGKTGNNVYATWDSGEEQYTSQFILNGTKQDYRKGQILSNEGSYQINLSDEIGNTATVEFSIDKSISFYIADIQGKTYLVENIKYINFDIRIVKQEPLEINIEKDNKDYEYQFGLMITEEGTYNVRMYDEYGNSYFFTFVIDKTPPTATLYGVENFGKTKGNAWVTSAEPNLTCWYVKNESVKTTYKIGQEITEHGEYVIYISDLAKNIISFEFEIDKEISFDINTYRGGISSEDVRLIAHENLSIIMYKDDKILEYNFGEFLKDDGEYSFTIIDELGNRTSSFFKIIKKKQQNLKHVLQKNIEVKNITFNDENFDFEIENGELYLYDEGTYKVEILDKDKEQIFNFDITLDTTPPTLVLTGVENGGSTKNIVVMKDVSETPYNIYMTVDGATYEYKIGSEIEKDGRFEVVLSDEAGNKTTYTFERLYSLNGPSIAILAGLGAMVILVIIFLIKSRKKYYKDVVEETIEETIIEDDFDDGDDVVINNDENDENGQN